MGIRIPIPPSFTYVQIAATVTKSLNLNMVLRYRLKSIGIKFFFFIKMSFLSRLRAPTTGFMWGSEDPVGSGKYDGNILIYNFVGNVSEFSILRPPGGPSERGGRSRLGKPLLLQGEDGNHGLQRFILGRARQEENKNRLCSKTCGIDMYFVHLGRQYAQGEKLKGNFCGIPPRSEFIEPRSSRRKLDES